MSNQQVDRAAVSGAVTPDASTPAVEVEALGKSFAGVVALRDVSLTVGRSEITALVGDNGAGKSTLIKCLSGLHTPDSGRILVDGQEAHLSSPLAARALGIETVYQDLGLVDDLCVWENLFLSREVRRGVALGNLLNKKVMRERSKEMLSQIGAAHRIPVDGQVRWMSGGQRQAVAIVRAVAWGARTVILDEPTAALGVNERAEVHDLIERLKGQGITVILISHNLDEVLQLADQVWVLNHGTVTAGVRGGDVTLMELNALLTAGHPRRRLLAENADEVADPGPS